MLKILISFSLFLSPAVFAHEAIEDSESDILLKMYERDLTTELREIGTLYNTILKADIAAEKKCEHIDAMKRNLVKCDLGLEQYMSILQSGHQPFYDPSSKGLGDASVKMLRAHQMKSQLEVYFSIVPTFNKNNSCNL